MEEVVWMNKYKVYIRTKDMDRKILNLNQQTPLTIKVKSEALNMTAKDAAEARLGTQMFMRKRYHMELGRDYKITRTVKQK